MFQDSYRDKILIPVQEPGVNSYRCDSLWYNQIFWQYQVNEIRATRGIRGELAQEPKVASVPCKHPLKIKWLSADVFILSASFKTNTNGTPRWKRTLNDIRHTVYFINDSVESVGHWEVFLECLWLFSSPPRILFERILLHSSAAIVEFCTKH